jgi:hypothetical protein
LPIAFGLEHGNLELRACDSYRVCFAPLFGALLGRIRHNDGFDVCPLPAPEGGTVLAEYV